jgi:hypothetical protein
MNKRQRKKARVANKLKRLVGVFVTAKLNGRIGPRQGWITQTRPLTIQGQSGTIYKCKGTPVRVTNPPRKDPNDAMSLQGSERIK